MFLNLQSHYLKDLLQSNFCILTTFIQHDTLLVMTNIQFMTIAQVAEELQVSPTTVRRYIKTGRLRSFKLGQGIKAAVRIKREELERLQHVGYEENMEALRKELLEDV